MMQFGSHPKHCDASFRAGCNMSNLADNQKLVIVQVGVNSKGRQKSTNLWVSVSGRAFFQQLIWQLSYCLYICSPQTPGWTTITQQRGEFVCSSLRARRCRKSEDHLLLLTLPLLHTTTHSSLLYQPLCCSALITLQESDTHIALLRTTEQSIYRSAALTKSLRSQSLQC